MLHACFMGKKGGAGVIRRGLRHVGLNARGAMRGQLR